MSRKVDPSAAANKDREAPVTGPLGTGTLAFEPRFSLETHYAGEAPAFAEGSQFGVYVVGPCIGEGGMARVYRAEHAGLKRQVALKVMTQGFARDKEGRERFLREARIAAAIKHPNVVNIFDVGVCQGIPYLVMELLEGEDLEKILLSRGSLDEGTIIDLVVPVVAGLVAVHDAGIVHRDLKPGNIFLARGRNDEFEPKLLDFGISKASGADHLRLTAANGSLMGTPFYMAPEAVQGAEMTPLSDQYALGVVLRECATGKNPFEGNNFAEVVRLISSAKYSAMTESHPRLSKRFVAIVERAMSVDPRNRFDDMRAMGRQLLLLAGQRTRITWGLTFGQENRGGPLAIAASERAPEIARSQPRRAIRKRAMLMLLGAVALLSAGVTSLLLVANRTDLDVLARPEAEAPPSEVTVVMQNKGLNTNQERGQEFKAEAAASSAAGFAERPLPEPTEALRVSPEPARAVAVSNLDSEAVAADVKAAPRRPQRAAVPAAERAERKPSRPAPTPPRRRPRAVPVAERVDAVDEPEEDWLLTPNPRAGAPRKRNVEVGSNNAPILD